MDYIERVLQSILEVEDRDDDYQSCTNLMDFDGARVFYYLFYLLPD